MKIILLIWFSAYNYGASATTIDGFESMAACNNAAALIKHEATQNRTRNNETIRTFCVQRNDT